MAGRVISLGGINVDLEVRLPRHAETGETLIAEQFLMHGGGKAANVAYCAARLGANCLLVGRVGSDPLKEEALGPLRAVGVDVSHVNTVPGQSTGVALLILEPDGGNTVLVASNANAIWTTEAAASLDDLFKQEGPGSVLVVDLEAPIDIIRRAMRLARGRGLVTVVDPAPASRMPADIYDLADYLTPNDLEAGMLAGMAVKTIDDASRAGRALAERGAGRVLVKMGAEGCVLVSRDAARHLAGFKVPVVDTTGAGDAFAGGVAVGLVEGLKPEEAARLAVATSALSVTKLGCQTSYPSRAEVEALILR